MDKAKPKSIQKIEHKMDELDPGSIRYRVLDSAKHFKSSWIELGQGLYSVWKDKIFKEWGYTEFDNYTKKEIGIRSATAMKLLRSYNFLEREEPKYLQKDFNKSAETAKVPTYEAVDVVRKAEKRKDIDTEDFKVIKKNVLEKGKDAKDAQLVVNKYVQQPELRFAEEDMKKMKYKRVKRFISLMRSVKSEIMTTEIIPKSLVKDMDILLAKLEENVQAAEDGK